MSQLDNKFFLRLMVLSGRTIADCVYSVAMIFTKLSVLLLTKRIFLQCAYDFFYWTIQLLIAANVIFYTCFVFIPIWACSPREKIWDPENAWPLPQPDRLSHVSVTWNLVSYIGMLSAPLWMIWKLQLSQRRKTAATFVFATAGLYVGHSEPTSAPNGNKILTTHDRSASIASIIRIQYLVLSLTTEDCSLTPRITPITE